LLFLFVSVISLYGQDSTAIKTKKNKFFRKDKITFGGNVGGNIGNNTAIYIAPRVGYYFTPSSVLGTQVIYQYTSSKVTQGTHAYGTGLWARKYFLERRLFAHSEWEALNRQNGLESRKWINSIMVGGGYFQSMGNRSGVGVSVMYIVNYKEATSPYPSPWVIRFGVSI